MFTDGVAVKRRAKLQLQDALNFLHFISLESFIVLMDKLSDFQLYALIINHDLDQDLKQQACAEFEKRNFSQEYLDQLALEYENIIPLSNTTLPIWEKMRIIAFPFIVPLQAILANRYISQGNPKKWKQYWKYLVVCWLVWIFLILLAIKFFYKELKA
jgi:hypothetical protein